MKEKKKKNSRGREKLQSPPSSSSYFLAVATKERQVDRIKNERFVGHDARVHAQPRATVRRG